jgi:hypothetical protein
MPRAHSIRDSRSESSWSLETFRRVVLGAAAILVGIMSGAGCGLVVGDIPPKAEAPGVTDGGTDSGIDAKQGSRDGGTGGDGDASMKDDARPVDGVAAAEDVDSRDALSSDDAGPLVDATPTTDVAPTMDVTSTMDANPPIDANPPVDASSPADARPEAEASCCDCDGDYHDGPQCGGKDCNDHNPDVFPGQTTYFSEPIPGGGFDYDCSTHADPDPDPTNQSLDCSTLAGLGCPNTQYGYFGPVPPCGTAAPWGYCKKTLLDCVETIVETTRKLKCK